MSTERRSRAWPLVRVLVVWTAGVVALTLILASVLVLASENRFLRREVERQGEALAQALGALAVGPAPAAAGDLAVARAPDLLSASVEAPNGALLWRHGPTEEEVRAGGEAMVTVQREVRVLDAATGTVSPVQVRLLLSTRRLRLHLLETGFRMILSLGAGLAILLGLGAVAVGRLALPLERLAAWARGFGSGAGDSPPEVAGSREVVDLAGAFGELVNRLEQERRAVEESEQRLKELFDVAPAPMLVVDEAGRIELANRASEPFLGARSEEPEGLDLSRFVAPAGASWERGEAVREVEWRMPEGGVAAVELAARHGLGPGGQGVLLVLHDLTDRLRRAGERWRRTFDALSDGVAILDSDGRRVLHNRTLEAWWPSIQDRVLERVRSGEAGEWQENLGQQALLVRLSRAEDGMILVVRDITERARGEESLRRALRAEAVAALAAGVAHDFNNLLSAMDLHLRLLERDPTGAGEALEAIQELAARGREVVEQLLDQVQTGEEALQRIDLDAVVGQSESFLRFLLEPEVALRVEPLRQPLEVCGRPAALRRVLLNLAVNARTALRGAKGAEVTFRTARRGEAAVVVVEDNGPGLPAGDPSRLFEASVSEGGGRGLGLAVVAAVVAEHGGAIRAERRDEGGARFVITLPLAGDEGCAPGSNDVP